MDTAPNGNDTASGSEAHSKRLALNTVFPVSAPTTTASNNVDSSSPRLVQNARAAATNTSGLHRLYAALTMEGIHTHRTSRKSGELPRNTIGAMY